MKKKRVLLIEKMLDYPQIMSITSLLRESGISYMIAESYKEALVIIGKNPFQFNLLLFDGYIEKESMGPKDFLISVRKINPDVPIISIAENEQKSVFIARLNNNGKKLCQTFINFNDFSHDPEIALRKIKRFI